MLRNSFYTVILLTAGEGVRFGSSYPKQFHRISGKKIYLHTLEQFLAVNIFDEILIVASEGHLNEISNDIKRYRNVPIKVVLGGSTRMESSYQGLKACHPDTEFVVIHDSVRPFVSKEVIISNIEEVFQHRCVDTCIPSSDTVVYKNDTDMIVEIPNRAFCWRGQTPQSFEHSLILEAHEKARSNHFEGVSDDCRLIKELGYPIKIVKGDESNIKITTELDLFVAEQIFRIKAKNISPSNRSIAGKRYIVTGGTSGIGKALCELLEQEGAIPISISRNSPKYSVDLTIPEQIKRALNDIGEVDGLINNSAALYRMRLDEMDEEKIEELINLNLKGLIYCCKFAQIKEKGHIINIASSSYSRGRSLYTVYSATKAAVVNFTQGLAAEREDLFVNALIPQRTKTLMREKAFGEEDTDTLLSPEIVSKEIVSLLKQDYLTGEMIEVRKNDHNKGF